MAKRTLTGRGDAGQIARTLQHEIQESAFSCELVEALSRRCGEANIYMMVFEKYYMRASNRASLTVLVCGAGDAVTVDAIGAGGGQGALFRFSWGAEEDFTDLVANILRPMGFRG